MLDVIFSSVLICDLLLMLRLYSVVIMLPGAFFKDFYDVFQTDSVKCLVRLTHLFLPLHYKKFNSLLYLWVSQCWKQPNYNRNIFRLPEITKYESKFIISGLDKERPRDRRNNLILWNLSSLFLRTVVRKTNKSNFHFWLVRYFFCIATLCAVPW